MGCGVRGGARAMLACARADDGRIISRLGRDVVVLVRGNVGPELF